MSGMDYIVKPVKLIGALALLVLPGVFLIAVAALCDLSSFHKRMVER